MKKMYFDPLYWFWTVVISIHIIWIFFKTGFDFEETLKITQAMVEKEERKLKWMEAQQKANEIRRKHLSISGKQQSRN